MTAIGLKMEVQAMPVDHKRIFVVFPVFEDEIHNALYALDLFVDPLVSKGYSVTAVVFSERHKKIIQDRAGQYQIACLRGSGFISRALAWLRYLLAQLNVPRLPPYMKARFVRIV